MYGIIYIKIGCVNRFPAVVYIDLHLNLAIVVYICTSFKSIKIKIVVVLKAIPSKYVADTSPYLLSTVFCTGNHHQTCTKKKQPKNSSIDL